MKSKSNPTLCGVMLTALVVLIATASAVAAPLKGSFYLPQETYWGGTLLPAGQYTLTMGTINPNIPVNAHGAVVLDVEVCSQSAGKPKNTRHLMVAYTESVPSKAASHLVVSRNGDTRVVNVMYSAATQTAFWFKVPKGYSVTTRIIAQQTETPVTEYVPITFEGK